MKSSTALTSSRTKNISVLQKTGNVFIKMGKWFAKKSNIVEIISSLLIILFIYTGLNKMLDYDTFKFQLGRSPFVQPIAGFIAATLPAGELLIALALILKRTRLLGLYASFFLMALFTGYIWAMLHYSYYVPCSCGGILAAMSWNDHLIFNSAFTALAMIGVILQSKINSIRKIPKATV
jgi:methylamine utilization protein MauE